MEVKAVAKHIRISPRKVRYVADMVRGKGVEEARAILKLIPNRGSVPVLKVLNSAVANAEHNNDMNEDELFVKKSFIDEGVTWKRIKPRAMGRADRINKRTGHITVVAVSYTHLNYLPSPIDVPPIGGYDPDNEEECVREADDNGPVSYTHLSRAGA